jgi:hypothetical protein
MIDICPTCGIREVLRTSTGLKFAHPDRRSRRGDGVLPVLPEPIGPCRTGRFSDRHADRSLVSRDIYRKFFKQPYRRLFEAIRRAAPQAKIFMHSCGSVRELIPEFIDIGLDILNALQPKAAGMDSFELKREFGRDLIFHGGLDIQGGINGGVERGRGGQAAQGSPPAATISSPPPALHAGRARRTSTPLPTARHFPRYPLDFRRGSAGSPPAGR